jgi:drug/metabolite transporter (DMT)-like permease
VCIIAVSRSQGEGDSSTLAILAVLAASCSYGTGAIFGRRFGQQSAFITGGVSLFLAGLITTPAALVFETPLALSPALTPTLALLALSLFSTALASLIFFRLLKTLGSLATTSNAYLRALFSILLGALSLGEGLSVQILAATLCIFMGVFLVTDQFRIRVYDRLIAKRPENA